MKNYSQMISDEKIKEVAKRLQKGEPAGEIREQLKEEGYSEEQITKLFPVHKYDMRSWYLAFAVFFLIAGLIFLLKEGGLHFLGLSGALFIAYFYEKGRVSKSNKTHSDNI